LGINETWILRAVWLKFGRQAGFAAKVLFPRLDDGVIAEKLKQRRLPAALAPLVRSMLPALQVSIHLTATKI